MAANGLTLSEHKFFPWTEDEQRQALAFVANNSETTFSPKREQRETSLQTPAARFSVPADCDMASLLEKIEISLANHASVQLLAGEGAMPTCVALVNLMEMENVAIVKKIETRTVERRYQQLESELHFTLTRGLKIQQELDRLAALKSAVNS